MQFFHKIYDGELGIGYLLGVERGIESEIKRKRPQKRRQVLGEHLRTASAIATRVLAALGLPTTSWWEHPSYQAACPRYSRNPGVD